MAHVFRNLDRETNRIRTAEESHQLLEVLANIYDTFLGSAFKNNIPDRDYSNVAIGKGISLCGVLDGIGDCNQNSLHGRGTILSFPLTGNIDDAINIFQFRGYSEKDEPIIYISRYTKSLPATEYDYSAAIYRWDRLKRKNEDYRLYVCILRPFTWIKNGMLFGTPFINAFPELTAEELKNGFKLGLNTYMTI